MLCASGLGIPPPHCCIWARKRSRPSGFCIGSITTNSSRSRSRVPASVPAASWYATWSAASTLDSSSPWIPYPAHTTSGAASRSRRDVRLAGFPGIRKPGIRCSHGLGLPDTILGTDEEEVLHPSFIGAAHFDKPDARRVAGEICQVSDHLVVSRGALARRKAEHGLRCAQARFVCPPGKGWRNGELCCGSGCEAADSAGKDRWSGGA